VTNIRDIERSLGDGVKRIYEGELASRTKLRRAMGGEARPTGCN
jgi:N-acetylneuraminate synthase